MKNDQINIATNTNFPCPRQDKQTQELQLIIVELPKGFDKVAAPEALKNLRSSSWATEELSGNNLDGVEWYTTDDEEVANAMYVEPVEFMTEESYRRFSRMVVPLFGGLYGFLSGPDMPPLDWIKRTFRNQMAVTQYWSHKKSDYEVPFLGKKSKRTIIEGLAQAIQGAMAEVAVCKCLGISNEQRTKLFV